MRNSSPIQFKSVVDFFQVKNIFIWFMTTPVHILWHSYYRQMRETLSSNVSLPILNPTEMAHSAFKAGVKRMLGLPQWQERMGDHNTATQAGVNLQVWRSRGLEEVSCSPKCGRDHSGKVHGMVQSCSNLPPKMFGETRH